MAVSQRSSRAREPFRAFAVVDRSSCHFSKSLAHDRSAKPPRPSPCWGWILGLYRDHKQHLRASEGASGPLTCRAPKRNNTDTITSTWPLWVRIDGGFPPRCLIPIASGWGWLGARKGGGPARANADIRQAAEVRSG